MMRSMHGVALLPAQGWEPLKRPLFGFSCPFTVVFTTEHPNQDLIPGRIWPRISLRLVTAAPYQRETSPFSESHAFLNVSCVDVYDFCICIWFAMAKWMAYGRHCVLRTNNQFNLAVADVLLFSYSCGWTYWSGHNLWVCVRVCFWGRNVLFYVQKDRLFADF